MIARRRRDYGKHVRPENSDEKDSVWLRAPKDTSGRDNRIYKEIYEGVWRSKDKSDTGETVDICIGTYGRTPHLDKENTSSPPFESANLDAKGPKYLTLLKSF